MSHRCTGSSVCICGLDNLNLYLKEALFPSPKNEFEQNHKGNVSLDLVLTLKYAGKKLRDFGQIFKHVQSKSGFMAALTVRKIIEIHDDLIKTYGGTIGILSEATLDMLVYKANQENNVFRKASLILHRITSQHPFFDGNKRTALVTAELVLYDEGYYYS